MRKVVVSHSNLRKDPEGWSNQESNPSLPHDTMAPYHATRQAGEGLKKLFSLNNQKLFIQFSVFRTKFSTP